VFAQQRMQISANKHMTKKITIPKSLGTLTITGLFPKHFLRLICAVILMAVFAGAIAIAFYISNDPGNDRHRMVYAETDDDETIIWAVPLHDLIGKAALARIDHASGYPIKAAISPDGTKMAYTLLPRGRTRPAFNGKLFLMDIKEGIQRELDDNIDYYTVPRWSPDSLSIVYAKTIILSQEKYRTELYSYSIDPNGLKKILMTDEESLGIYPIGYSPNGKQFYYDRIIPEGDELWVINLNSNLNRFIAKISIGMAWNLSLSPDGKEILGSVIESRSPASYAVISISINDKKRYVWTKGSQRHYTPIWGPNINDITTNIPTGNYDIYQGELKILNRMFNSEVQLGSSNEWMNVPYSWSPDKHWLIFERYHNLGSNRDLNIMDYEGVVRQTLTSPNWLGFVGWITEVR